MRILIVLTLLIVGSACSQKWREADPGIDGNEALDRLSELNGSSSLTAMMTDDELDRATLYYMSSETSKIPAKSVAAISFFTFVGLDDSVTNYDLKNASVYFVDDPFAANGHNCSLAVEFEFDQGSAAGRTVSETFSCVGSPRVSDGEYIAELTGGITVRSFDIDEDGLLNSIIQLDVFEDFNGSNDYIGKFSTLVGFGPN